MYIILEGYKVGIFNNIIEGKTQDRVILYHSDRIEELLKGGRFRIEDSVDLLSGKRATFDLFQLEQFIKVGIQL